MLKIDRNKSEDGFTLIELLIVVLIIGILAAVAIPIYLGIQNNAHKSDIQQDVHNKVTDIQVALTEGSTMASLKAQAATTGSDGESVAVADSTATNAGPNEFSVTAGESTANGGNVNYTYTYDSVSGTFSSSATAYVYVNPSELIVTVPLTGVSNGAQGGEFFMSSSVNSANTPANFLITKLTGKSVSGLPTAARACIPSGDINSGNQTGSATNTTVTNVRLYDSSNNLITYTPGTTVLSENLTCGYTVAGGGFSTPRVNYDLDVFTSSDVFSLYGSVDHATFTYNGADYTMSK